MENKENPLQAPTEDLYDPQKAVAYLNAVKLAALTNPGNTRLQIASMHASGHPATLIATLTGLGTENIVRAVNTAMHPHISIERNLVAYGAGTKNKATQRSPEYTASMLKSWLLSKDYSERTCKNYNDDAAELGLPSIGTIARSFGSWVQALEELNIPAPSISGDYNKRTREGIEKYFLEFLAETPKDKITTRNYEEWSNKTKERPSWLTVNRVMGVKTWNELLVKFGVKPVRVRSPKNATATNNQLIKAVHDYVNETRNSNLSLDDFYDWVENNLGSGDVAAFKNIIVTKYAGNWVNVLTASAS